MSGFIDPVSPLVAIIQLVKEARTLHDRIKNGPEEFQGLAAPVLTIHAISTLLQGSIEEALERFDFDDDAKDALRVIFGAALQDVQRLGNQLAKCLDNRNKVRRFKMLSRSDTRRMMQESLLGFKILMQEVCLLREQQATQAFFVESAEPVKHLVIEEFYDKVDPEVLETIGEAFTKKIDVPDDDSDIEAEIPSSNLGITGQRGLINTGTQLQQVQTTETNATNVAGIAAAATVGLMAARWLWRRWMPSTPLPA
ncbi:MAG: hypothetical protein Q9165_008128 [Trypethelium subeluteriae]